MCHGLATLDIETAHREAEQVLNLVTPKDAVATHKPLQPTAILFEWKCAMDLQMPWRP